MSTVLLVEPNHFLGATYQEALQRAGHEVIWSRNAQGAVHAADGLVPDVVVLELQLPGHSGIEFLYEFRSYADWQTIPVILHTFVDLEALAGAVQHFGRLGITSHLYKPVTSLQRLVREIAQTTVPV